MNHRPAPQPAPAADPAAPLPAAGDDALREIEQLARRLNGLAAGPPASPPPAASSAASQDLRLLEQVLDHLSVHHDNDELLADAMNEVSALAGSPRVWLVEAGPDHARGSVHVLGELIIGDSELPRDVERLCEALFDRRFEPCDQLGHALPGGNHRVAMSLRVNNTYFGTLVYTVVPDPPVPAAVRDRLLTSVLRFLAISIENRHFVDSLSEMIVEVVCGFSLAIESRDAYTGGHVMRVTAYALALAEALHLSDEDKLVLRLGGLLHDIGKVAIPDDILNKQSRLNEIERDVMQAHAAVGFEILQRIPHLTASNKIVRHHHERWDGAGYPDRLAGAEIPRLARILAITDAFDAMTSDRPYRKGRDHAAAMTEIRACAGTQFDPDLAAAFVELTEQQLAVAEARMHRWIHSHDHGNGLNLGHLIALNKPSLRG